MKYISHSAAQALWRCPESYRLEYIAGVVPATKSAALLIGTAAATARETGDLSEAAIRATGLDGHDAAKAMALVRARDQYWAHVGDGLTEPGTPELRIERPIPSVRGWRLAMVLDHAYHDGATVSFREDKTCGPPLEQAIQEHKAGAQLATYQAGRYDGKPCILDVARKPTLRPKKEEEPGEYYSRCMEAYDAAPSEFFRRVTVEYDSAKVAAVLQWYRQAISTIRHHTKHGWPRMYGGGCRTPYGWCQYKALCWYCDSDGYERKGTGDPGMTNNTKETAS